MNGASSSNPPPPPAPPAVVAAAAESSHLAPGFRFHPTDEELVSYYLKRKVFGRPLRVDAIAEVELYKAEPWDLPALSRLRSRDMEWYFFSPLDRKYANRSRTNRATSQGYWKTTGKDRPVRRGPRTVGMKKTLVFHVGRAPRGERTNWVMHEYRLEDEQLVQAGIPQDLYVVCRIFQKSGSGPQNGAQYGAPFNEDEWEVEADNMTLAIVNNGAADASPDDSALLALPPVGGSDPAVVGNGEYFQLSDLIDNLDQGNQFEPHGGPLTGESDGQNSGSAPEDDPIFLVEGIFQDEGYTDVMNAPGQQDCPYTDVMSAPGPQDHSSVSDNMGGNTGPAVQSPSPPSQNCGFVELNDIVDTAEFFDSINENADTAAVLQMYPFQDDFYLEPSDLNLRDFAYPSDQAVEENPVFYDAPSNYLPFEMENFVQMNDLYSPIAGSCGFSAVDDISHYFDSTVNHSKYPALDDSSENLYGDSSALMESNSSPEVGSTVPTSVQACVAVGASSSVCLPGAGNWSTNINENVTVVPDSRGPEGCNKTLTKCLVNMLGSLSAPPALASEFPTSPGKSFGQTSATSSSSSSIHVAAGMIQIHGFKVMGRAEHWSLHKNGDMGFLLSYGVSSSKSDGDDSITKIRGCSLSVVLRGGFYLFFLSFMVLALCAKVGMRVYCN